MPVQKVKGAIVDAMELVLDNLEKFTRYTVSIQAYNKLGAGPKNVPEVVAKTQEDGNFRQHINSNFMLLHLISLHLFRELVKCLLSSTFLLFEP